MPTDPSNEAWRVPLELEQSPPRRVRLSGVGFTRLVIALACIVFGVGMAIRVCNDELRRQAANDSLTRRLTAEGRETEATVTGLRTGLGYVVSFDYAVDGRSFERSAFIASEHWQSLQVGSPLTICYLPSDPSKAYPDTDPPSSQSHWPTSLPMAGMILLFMLSFAAIFLSAILPQRRLLARGFPARGVITRCKEGSKGRSSGYYLNYDFPLQDGPSCQGKEFSGSQQAEGASVTVLYDPNNPRRNALYPLESVRMAAS